MLFPQVSRYPLLISLSAIGTHLFKENIFRKLNPTQTKRNSVGISIIEIRLPRTSAAKGERWRGVHYLKTGEAKRKVEIGTDG